MFLARATVLPWVITGHTPITPMHAQGLTRPWLPRKSSRRPTAMLAGVARFAKRSAKRLGRQAASQMLGPVTRNGLGSMPWGLLASARQQIAPEAGGAAQAVDCSACRAGCGAVWAQGRA